MKNMDLIIFGIGRSGTTLLTDMLCVPNQSFVIYEPHLGWSNVLLEQFKNFDLKVEKWEDKKYNSVYEYIDENIVPQLKNLNLWGAKFVRFYEWKWVLKTYQPKKIILCVRDIRDVAISSLDIDKRIKLGKEWHKERIIFAAKSLIEMCELPHLLIKYEDLCLNSKEIIKKLLDYLEIKKVNYKRQILNWRDWEFEKHGTSGISSKSVSRYLNETSKEKLSFMNEIFEKTKDYSKKFGYMQ